MYVSYHPLECILCTVLHLTFIYETYQFIKDKVKKVTCIQNRYSVHRSCCLMSSVPRFCCDCSLHHHCLSTVPTTAPWLCLQPECLHSFLPQALCICSSTAWNYPMIPGISHTARCQFKYRLSREALCPPDLQRYCHSGISALFSIPHFMSSISENSFSGAGLTLQLSLDVPLANTSCFTGHQPQTRPLVTVRKCDPQILLCCGA